MYQINITFSDGRKGHITETFASKGEAETNAVIWWLNQPDFDATTEVIKVN